ncbi:N-acetylglucosaminyl-diphospho-decaprenol L-rhamnosyltransferase [bacterium HR30]|nr:N-acetylglucosaminyl-diphospho-decaprenol L-rhamnosyltransferase [bacterium HR30]
MAEPHVAIVILNWNGKDDVLRCLSTLTRIRYPNWSATVVDNASFDGSVEAIRQQFPSQRVLVMEKNLGFCGGNNRGIADALDRGADYVLLLNNDTELHPELVSELVRVAESDCRIGAVGAKNILLEDHQIVWGAYGELKYHRDLVHLVGSRVPDGPELTVVKDVDWVIGNGMMMRREAIETVGGFDENFFGYHEDVDWCARARKAGFRIVYNGHAIIYHRGFGAANPARPRPFPVLYFLGRNSILFARKHATVPQLCKFVTLFFLGVSWWMVAGVFRGDRLKSYLWLVRGFLDGVTGRLPLRELGLQ